MKWSDEGNDRNIVEPRLKHGSKCKKCGEHVLSTASTARVCSDHNPEIIKRRRKSAPKPRKKIQGRPTIPCRACNDSSCIPEEDNKEICTKLKNQLTRLGLSMTDGALPSEVEYWDDYNYNKEQNDFLISLQSTLEHGGIAPYLENADVEEDERLVIELRFKQGASLEEVAEALGGVSKVTAFNKLNNALEKIKKTLPDTK